MLGELSTPWDYELMVYGAGGRFGNRLNIVRMHATPSSCITGHMLEGPLMLAILICEAEQVETNTEGEPTWNAAGSQ